MSDPVTVSITANIKGLIDGLAQATEVVKKNTEEMTKTFGGLGKAFDNLKAPFVAITGLLAGGKLFKDAVDAAGKWNLETVKMARTLGTTTQEASVLKVALHGLGIDQDVYTRGVTMMSRQISTGGAGFNKLGIEIRDSNGHLKPATTLMNDALDKLNGLKGGVDRNAAGIALFGRGWADIAPLLLMNKTRMAEARKEAEELHLIVGPEGAAKAREYAEAKRKLGLVEESLSVQIGNQLMPVLVALGSWLGKVGPGMAAALAGAIKTLASVFFVMKAAVETVVTYSTAALMSLWTILKTVGTALIQIIQGDYSEAWKTMKGGWQQFSSDANVAFDMTKESWKEAATDIVNVWNDKPLTKGKPEEKAPSGADYVPEDANKLFRVWQEQLAKTKNLRENWFTWDAARELQFWETKLSMVRGDTELYGKVLEKVLVARKAKASEEIALARETAKIHETEALGELDAKVSALAQQREAGDISAQQELSALIVIEQEKLEVKKAAIEAEMILEGVTDAQREKLMAERVAAIRASSAKIREIGLKLQKDQQAAVSSFLDPFVKGFESGISRMLQGTLSFSSAIRGIWGMLRGALLQSITQMVSDWIAGLAKKLAAFIVNKTQELIFHQGAEAAKATSSVGAATVSATASAVEAGAAASASAAESGPAGWMIAIPVGLAVLAGVLAMTSSIRSAAGGYDIPGNVNPMIQGHASEMMLPAKHAQVIRDLADGKIQGQGGHVFQLSVTAMDGASVMRVLTSNEGKAALVKSMTQLARDGRMSSKGG